MRAHGSTVPLLLLSICCPPTTFMHPPAAHAARALPCSRPSRAAQVGSAQVGAGAASCRLCQRPLPLSSHCWQGAVLLHQGGSLL